jgi:hypothetical protein
LFYDNQYTLCHRSHQRLFAKDQSLPQKENIDVSEDAKPDLATLTVQLLSAYVGNNAVPSGELANLIRSTKRHWRKSRYQRHP